ncbi:MAG: DAK2 domain-containing protein [Chloroflexota bacterium]|nr:MAG: DAK2 domain-containing protein [Chloroflexota bacterium]
MTDGLRAAILAAADAIDAARGELGALDGAAGDGDHGMTMSIGARNVRRRFATLPEDAPDADLVRAAASAMGGVGGAIGPLYAAALGAIAAELDRDTGGEPGIAIARGAAQAAEAAVVRLGHAAVGDKTVLDALHPLAESLRDSEAAGRPRSEALAHAVKAADAGVAETAGMIARIGRASRLGERSRGQPDAGARSFAIIVRALVDWTGQGGVGEDRPA